VFDTETTGVAMMKYSVKNQSQPHLVELAFEMFCSDRQEVVGKYSFIVNPGIEVPDKVAKVHGIDTGMAAKYGISEKLATAMFHHHMLLADRIVGHNVAFDLFVMQVAYARNNRSVVELLAKPTHCTMLESMDIVQIAKPEWQQKKYGDKYKWPSLEETYKALISDKGFQGAHRAHNDVAATREIMVELDIVDFAAKVERGEPIELED